MVPCVEESNANAMVPTACGGVIPAHDAPNQAPRQQRKSGPLSVPGPVAPTFEPTYQCGNRSAPYTKSVAKRMSPCWATFTPQPASDSAGALYQRSPKSVSVVVACAQRLAPRAAAQATAL